MSTTSHHIMPISESNWDLYDQIIKRSQAHFEELKSMDPGSKEWEKTLGKAEALSDLAQLLYKQFQREASLLEEVRNTMKKENYV